MAASDYAAGRQQPIFRKIPDELVMYDLVDRYHWTPDQIRAMKFKDIKALTLISSICSKVQKTKNKK
jgi:hypothetical protein